MTRAVATRARAWEQARAKKAPPGKVGPIRTERTVWTIVRERARARIQRDDHIKSTSPPGWITTYQPGIPP